MNPRVLKRFIAFYILFFLSIQYSYSQITVVDSQTAVQLVQKLAGLGVTVSNATLTCVGRASGKFTTVSSNLNMSEGIILTSGRADDAVGVAASVFGGASNGSIG